MIFSYLVTKCDQDTSTSGKAENIQDG